jgi:peptidoglycan/LPS O-acetylase OafA/YrhL
MNVGGQSRANTFVPDERHWSVLSLARFLLALEVVLFHVGVVVKPSPMLQSFGSLSMVACFFVISGYSIASSLNRNPHAFYLRRAIRIYPLSICGILYAFLMVHLFHPVSITGYVIGLPNPISFASVLLLLNGLVRRTPDMVAPYWSLGCEAVFYVVAPLIVRCSSSGRVAMILISLAIFVAFSMGIHGHNFGDVQILAFTHISVFWIWLIGFVAFSTRWKTVTAVNFTALALVLFITDGYKIVSGISTCVVLLIILNLDRICVGRRWIPVFNYLGELSYPLYVLHFITVLLFVPFGRTHGLCLTTVACVGACLSVSIAAYHLIDVPIRKRRFHPQPL